MGKGALQKLGLDSALVLVVLGAGLEASAQQLRPPANAAHHQRPWLRGTTSTLRAGGLSLGLLEAQVGVLDPVTVGTIAPLWATVPVFGAPTSNGHVKVRTWFLDPLTLALRVDVLHTRAGKLIRRLTELDDANLTAWAFPTHLMASVSTTSVTPTVGLLYSPIRARGSSASNGLTAEASLDTVWATLRLELPLSHKVSLQLDGRLLVHEADRRADSHYRPEPGVDARARLGVEPQRRFGSFSLVPAMAFRLGPIDLAVGAGYGRWTVPIVELPLDRSGPLARLELQVRL